MTPEKKGSTSFCVSGNRNDRTRTIYVAHELQSIGSERILKSASSLCIGRVVMKTREEALMKIRIKLENRREALSRLLADDVQEFKGATNDVGDMIDAALDAEHLEMQSLLATTESREFQKIEKALQKMATNQYGRCDACSQEIPLNRLEAVLYATLCVKCQNAADARRKRTRKGQIDWPTSEEATMNGDLPVLDFSGMKVF
jgi:DnaK suppressor protein